MQTNPFPTSQQRPANHPPPTTRTARVCVSPCRGAAFVRPACSSVEARRRPAKLQRSRRSTWGRIHQSARRRRSTSAAPARVASSARMGADRDHVGGRPPFMSQIQPLMLARTPGRGLRFHAPAIRPKFSFLTAAPRGIRPGSTPTRGGAARRSRPAAAASFALLQARSIGGRTNNGSTWGERVGFPGRHRLPYLLVERAAAAPSLRPPPAATARPKPSRRNAGAGGGSASISSPSGRSIHYSPQFVLRTQAAAAGWRAPPGIPLQAPDTLLTPINPRHTSHRHRTGTGGRRAVAV